MQRTPSKKAAKKKIVLASAPAMAAGEAFLATVSTSAAMAIAETAAKVIASLPIGIEITGSFFKKGVIKRKKERIALSTSHGDYRGG